MAAQLHLIERLQAIGSDDRGGPGERFSRGLFHCIWFRKVAAGDAPVATMSFLRFLGSRYQGGS